MLTFSAKIPKCLAFLGKCTHYTMKEFLRFLYARYCPSEFKDPVEKPCIDHSVNMQLCPPITDFNR